MMIDKTSVTGASQLKPSEIIDDISEMVHRDWSSSNFLK
jgi:hypothetical protein